MYPLIAQYLFEYTFILLYNLIFTSLPVSADSDATRAP
jgi:magnesium-transporting ATPase (P-type)